MVFFYVHLDVLVATWLLPPATKIIQFHKKVYNDFPGRYLQLPATTRNGKTSESVYEVASYLQLPVATKYQVSSIRKVIVKSFTWILD